MISPQEAKSRLNLKHKEALIRFEKYIDDKLIEFAGVQGAVKATIDIEDWSTSFPHDQLKALLGEYIKAGWTVGYPGDFRTVEFIKPAGKVEKPWA